VCGAFDSFPLSCAGFFDPRRAFFWLQFLLKNVTPFGAIIAGIMSIMSCLMKFKQLE